MNPGFNLDTPVPRLDVWLDVSCLFKTRSEAQRACKGGKVALNGHSVKPHREVKVGDVLEITRALGRRQRVVVEALADRHIPKEEARRLYRDTTPPPSPEEQALLDLMRLAGPHRRTAPVGSPDKRERRRLRGEKEGRGGPRRPVLYFGVSGRKTGPFCTEHPGSEDPGLHSTRI